MNEYPCINTSYDEKKFPGINHGKFSSLPLKYSKIDNIIIRLMCISPNFSEINFVITKAIPQIKDRNNGSKVAAKGIKNK